MRTGVTVLVLLAASTLLSAADPLPLRRARLNIIASESIFPTVNHGDAIAALKVVAETVARIRGFQVDSAVEVGRSAEELKQRLSEKAVDLLVMDSPHYLALAALNLVEVVGAGTNKGKLAAYPYLLLVPELPSSGQFSALRGKRIVVCSRTKSDLGAIWLDTLLAEHSLGRPKDFFSSVALVYKPSTCVLPLFFGKIDACVVDSAGWDLIRELNPQLSRLTVLAHSEPLLEGLIAMPAQPHPYRQEIIDSLLQLHLTPVGQQLSTLFRTGPLIRARPDDFKSVQVLLQRHAQIASPKSNASVAPSGREGSRRSEGDAR